MVWWSTVDATGFWCFLAGGAKMNARTINMEQACFWVFSLVFAGVAAYLTMWATSLYGVGLSPDSVGYIRLARDISENGLAFLSESKAVQQPPFFPAVLALLSRLTGSDPFNVARSLNVVSSAAFSVITMLSVARVGTPLPITLATGFLGCFSIPLIHVFSYAWTEPSFILEVYGVFLIVTSSGPNLPTALASGFVTAAACLTRYSGLVLIPLVSTYLLLVGSGPMTRRLKFVLAYAATPCLLSALYLLRNYSVSSYIFGERGPSNFGLAANVSLAAKTSVTWFLPERIGSWLTRGITSCATAELGFFVLLGMLGWFQRDRIADVIRGSHRIVALCAVFVLVYTGFIVWTSTMVAYDAIDDRLLAPVYPSLLVVFALFLERGVRGGRGRSILVLCLFCWVFIASPVRRVVSAVRTMAHEGVGYNSRIWRESDLVGQFVRNGQSPNELLFSNAPDVLYILANVTARMSPEKERQGSDRTTEGPAKCPFEEHPESYGVLLVWFDTVKRLYLLTPGEIEPMCSMQAVGRFKDGTIYRIRSSGTASEAADRRLAKPRR